MRFAIYSVMSQTAFGQTAADGIIVHDDLFGYLIACSLVCQSAHLQDVTRHLETEDCCRFRNCAVFAAPQQHVALVQPAETHIHANLSEEKEKKRVGEEKKSVLVDTRRNGEENERAVRCAAGERRKCLNFSRRLFDF